MKVKTWDGSVERRVLAKMITDDATLGRVASKWDGRLFASVWANIVATWCIDFHRKHGKAPGQGITSLFETWAARDRDEETIKLVERFLEACSDELSSEVLPVREAVIDEAGELFNRVRLSRLSQEVQGHLDVGRVEDAVKAVSTFSRVELGVGKGVDIFSDQAFIEQVFAEKEKDLFKYPGALGNFFKGDLSGDSLLAFLAPEKTGKTWWLVDMAWRAMSRGRRVAFFEVGDMSEGQLAHRFFTRAIGIPHRAPEGKWPCVVRIPSLISPPSREGGEAEVDWREEPFDRTYKVGDAQAACEEVTGKWGNRGPLFRLATYPNSSVNVAGIRADLDGWALEGWVPDVIVIDYADILAAPEGFRGEFREGVNLTWKQLRALSQERHALVVTATQADAGSYEKRTLDRRNFSEDKRKLSHVTSMVGINVTPAEKELGICRLNWIVRREMEFSPRKCCHVAQCLPLAQPAVKSTF